jgi:hypothetical protein
MRYVQPALLHCLDENMMTMAPLGKSPKGHFFIAMFDYQIILG